MKLSRSIRLSLLLLGDITALYASLAITLFLRYGGDVRTQLLENHLVPFSILFGLWIVVFYIAGLYDPRRLRNNIEFVNNLSTTLVVNALLGITTFYLIPTFGIAPKTNLFIFLGIFAVLETWWRRTFNVRASFREGLVHVALLDRSPRAEEISRELGGNPHFGYQIAIWPEEPWRSKPMETVREMITRHNIQLVVVPATLKHDAETRRMLYELLAFGVEICDLPTFYETVFQKVPLADINESWFIERNVGRRAFSDDLKRAGELLFAVTLGIALLPLEILIAALVRLSSPGPAIYRQVRIGTRNAPFTLYKFRTMRVDAERNGPQWKSSGERDPRFTAIGRLLAKTHLDELPQLWNIIRGELSFVGPRPERPEFVSVLETEVPHYNARHLVKPGVTGWAQISYRYGASVEDAYRKLEYDLYYLEHRSLVMDIAIVLKTIKSFFINQT